MATYQAESDVMAALATTLDTNAAALTETGGAAHGLLVTHGFAAAAQTVDTALQSAGTACESWARSLRDRVQMLEDPAFRDLAQLGGGPLAVVDWPGGSPTDPELNRFEVWRGQLKAAAAGALADATTERALLQEQLTALSAAPYQVAAAQGPDLERDLAEATIRQLQALRMLALLDGDAGAASELATAALTLEYELYVTAPKPPVDEAAVAASTDRIMTLLNESWFGDVSGDELREITTVLSGLAPAEFDSVIAELNDAELYRWFHELDGVRGGNLSADEELAMFGTLAEQGSAETMWRLALAERGGKLLEVTNAVYASAPPLVQMRFAELAATHYPGPAELIAPVAGWAELDDSQVLVVGSALATSGALDRFLDDAAGLRESLMTDGLRDDPIPVEMLDGLLHGVLGSVQAVNVLTLQGIWDRHAFRTAWSGIGALGSLAIRNPGTFLATVVDLDTLRTNPAYWTGQLVPELIGTKGALNIARGGRLGAALQQVTLNIDDLATAGRLRVRVRTGTPTLSDLFEYHVMPPSSVLMEWAKNQGWTLRQNPNGPPIWLDANGVKRLTIKYGSARTPGSAFPHIEIRDPTGQLVDPFGFHVRRHTAENHTPIVWDIPHDD